MLAAHITGLPSLNVVNVHFITQTHGLQRTLTYINSLETCPHLYQKNTNLNSTVWCFTLWRSDFCLHLGHDSPWCDCVFVIRQNMINTNIHTHTLISIHIAQHVDQTHCTTYCVVCAELSYLSVLYYCIYCIMLCYCILLHSHLCCTVAHFPCSSLHCVPFWCFCYCFTTEGTTARFPVFTYMWMFDNKNPLDLIRPDIPQLPNEVGRGNEAGRACEDKNNKQQRFWLEGKVSGRVDVGHCEPTFLTSWTDRERKRGKKKEERVEKEGEQCYGV